MLILSRSKFHLTQCVSP